MSDATVARPRAAWVDEGEGRIRFHCPGCKCSHNIVVKGDAQWWWNGSFELPTFTPSVLTWGREWVQDDPADTSRVKTETPGVFRVGGPGHFVEVRRCHSFVTDGRIQFLTDCAHALAGQTVDLPTLESQ